MVHTSHSRVVFACSSSIFPDYCTIPYHAQRNIIIISPFRQLGRSLHHMAWRDISHGTTQFDNYACHTAMFPLWSQFCRTLFTQHASPHRSTIKMDGNQTSFAVIVRLSEVHGIFLNDRDDDRFIESLEANKEQLQEATSRTSSFLTVNREEYGKKLVSIKNVDKQLEQLEKQKQQLIREKRSLKEEADLYHITFVVSWERQAAKDTAGIEKLEADISVSACFFSLSDFVCLFFHPFSFLFKGCSSFDDVQTPCRRRDPTPNPHDLCRQPSQRSLPSHSRNRQGHDHVRSCSHQVFVAHWFGRVPGMARFPGGPADRLHGDCVPISLALSPCSDAQPSMGHRRMRGSFL